MMRLTRRPLHLMRYDRPIGIVMLQQPSSQVINMAVVPTQASSPPSIRRGPLPGFLQQFLMAGLLQLPKEVSLATSQV
jgi:hypothetical protein